MELDDDGYPTEQTLEEVRTWEAGDGPGLLTHLRAVWWNGETLVSPPVSEEDCWRFSTGGWSGNEALIEAMLNNKMWFWLHWISSRRGGHYEFDNRRLTPWPIQT